MYRLHIDIPLHEDQELSIKASQAIIAVLAEANKRSLSELVNEINYRLGNDLDRSKKNYLDINEDGHASTRKMQL